MRAVWAVIGLGFFNLVIVLGPFIALIGIVFSGWALSLGFILSPIGVLMNAVWGAFQLFDLFVCVSTLRYWDFYWNWYVYGNEGFK